MVCLKHKLKASAPSLTPWQLLDQFARIQMVEVWFKLRAGGCICLETHHSARSRSGWSSPEKWTRRAQLIVG